MALPSTAPWERTASLAAHVEAAGLILEGAFTSVPDVGAGPEPRVQAAKVAIAARATAAVEILVGRFMGHSPP